MFKLTKKRVGAGIAIGALAIGAPMAFSYWTEGGTGTGTAGTGTTEAIAVNQTSTVAGLYPDGPALELSGTFTNPNQHDVFIERLSAVVVDTEDREGNVVSGCTADDFAITSEDGEGDNEILVQKEIDDGDTWRGLFIQLVNDHNRNQDACKDVTVNIAYTANPLAAPAE